jgi:hypothetical protein
MARFRSSTSLWTEWTQYLTSQQDNQERTHMSTRAVIARQTDPDDPGCWEGRYHHWDGYPSGLGRALWHAYHSIFIKTCRGCSPICWTRRTPGAAGLRL